MNTATRVVSTHPYRLSLVALLLCLQEYIWVLMMSLAVFISAMSVLYAKDLHRRLYIRSQTIAHQSGQLIQDYAKLRLEKTALLRSSRLHTVAKRLNMVPIAHIVRVPQE